MRRPGEPAGPGRELERRCHAAFRRNGHTSGPIVCRRSSSASLKRQRSSGTAWSHCFTQEHRDPDSWKSVSPGRFSSRSRNCRAGGLFGREEDPGWLGAVKFGGPGSYAPGRRPSLVWDGKGRGPWAMRPGNWIECRGAVVFPTRGVDQSCGSFGRSASLRAVVGTSGDGCTEGIARRWWGLAGCWTCFRGWYDVLFSSRCLWWRGKYVLLLAGMADSENRARRTVRRAPPICAGTLRQSTITMLDGVFGSPKIRGENPSACCRVADCVALNIP